jgi:DNA-nicking Smr family endonuclease
VQEPAAWPLLMRNGGWRMRSNKAGLADLKRLHAAAQAASKAEEERATIQKKQQQADSVASAADRQLFARMTEAVKPLAADPRILHRAASGQARGAELEQRRARAAGQAPEPALGLSDGLAGFAEDQSDLHWAAPGIGPDVQRQLRRAYWPVSAHLDLHGLNSDQARTALASFVAQSQGHGARCIRIVHGKGYGSQDGQPVLKSRVAHWLTQLPAVSAFASAPAAHGGQGALLVLIRLP